MNVLIDSSGWIEYFAKGKLAEKFSPYIEKASKANYFTPTIVLYEVYKKIKATKGQETAAQAYAHIVANTEVVELDENIAVQAADLSLKHSLAMADAIVKATAEAKAAKVITADKDFSQLKDVVYIK